MEMHSNNHLEVKDEEIANAIFGNGTKRHEMYWEKVFITIMEKQKKDFIYRLSIFVALFL